jgi:hypothetical protein
MQVTVHHDLFEYHYIMEEMRASRSMHREIFRLQFTKLQAENLKEDLA